MSFNGDFEASQGGGFGGTQFGGGGFIADEGKTYGTQNNYDNTQGSPQSQGGGGAAARKRDEQSLTPVTIRQLQGADLSRESKIRIDGRDIAQATILGSILSIEVQPTNINCILDDGTGQIDVRHYIDPEDQHLKGWKQGDYVRVIGNLRVISGKLSMVGFQLLPIVDFNELTFHFLEVIQTHLRNVKGPLNRPVKVEGGNMYGGATPGGGYTPGGYTPGGFAGVASPPPARFTQGSGAHYGNSSSSSSSSSSCSSGNGGFQSPGFQGHNAAPAPLARGPGGPAVKNAVHDVVMDMFNGELATEQGTHIELVIKRLSHIPAEQVKKAIEYLTDEGHLYSTIDEMHYKSTNN